MNTRKYPRTLNEAFGPYSHLGPLVEKQDPMPHADKAVLAYCGIAAVVLVCFAIIGWV